MADLDITGRVTVDASQAEGAFDRVGARAEQMSEAVAGASGRAGKSIASIGAGAAQSGEQLTKSQARVRDEIDRTTSRIENLGKTASQRFEIKIAAQGLDPAIYAPYLARLREVEAAQLALRNSGRQAADGAEEAGGAFSSLKNFAEDAKGALIGLAAGLSVGAFAGWVKGAIDTADAAGKLASSAGLAVEELAGLQLAFEGADAGDKLQSTLSKLAAEAQKGNGAFAAMGIAVTNSSGGLKSTRDLLGEVSDKFASYRDGAEKTALAQKLLDVSGAALIPLFNGGSAALAEFDETAKALGLTLSNEAAEAAGQFNDQIDLITQRSQGLARQLASQLLPVLATIAEQFGSAAKQGGSFSLVGTGLSVVLETITVLGSNVAFVFRALARDAQLLFSSAVKLATLDFSGIRSGFAEYKFETDAARKSLDQFQASVITARSLASAGDLDEPWVKRARIEAQAAAEAAKKLAPQVAAVTTARGASKKATEAATAALKAETEALKARIAAGQSANAAFDDEFKIIEAAREAVEGRIKSGREMLESIERETALLGLSNTEREQAIALFALEKAGVIAGTEAYDAYAAKIREAISARGNKQTALDAIKAETEATAQAAKDATAEWQKTADSINSSLTDALMRGFEDGKGFAKNLRDTLVNMFKTLILRPIISAVLAPIAGGLSGAANAATGGGGGGGGLSGIASLASNASSLFSIGSQVAASTMSIANGIGTIAANATGTGISGLLATNGAFGTAAGAGGAAGMGASISAGLAAIGPVGWAAIAVGALGLGGAFSRKLKDSGIQGEFGGERGFEGNSFEFLKGGMFRSDKTKTNPLAEESRKALGDAFQGMRTEVGIFATALGLNTDKIAGFSSSIKLSLKGLSEADANKKIEEALATANNALAEQVLGTFTSVSEQIKKTIQTGNWSEGFDATFEEVSETITKTSYVASEFARDGEKAIDTLKRLSGSLMVVNGTFDTLGRTLLETSLAGGDLASKLADAFGGLENLAAATSSYYEAFYTDAQRAETTTRQLGETLGKLGLALPASNAAFRELVELQNLNTESGRTNYAALLSLSGDFASVFGTAQQAAQLADDATTALADAARQLGIDAAKAAEALAATNQGIQDQIDVLTGAQTERSIALRDAGDDSTRALMQVVYGLQDLKTASEAAAQAERTLAQSRLDGAQTAFSAAQAATSEAQALLDRSVAAERATIDAARTAVDATRTAAQSVVQEMQGVFDSLTAAMRELYGDVASTAAMGASAGRAFVDNALANARATGYLPDGKALSEAIGAARGGMGDDQYASAFERDRERLVLAGKLSELASIAEPQLSAAERAVKLADDQLEQLNGQTKALDDMLRIAKDELDALRGIDTSTKSVAGAIANMRDALVLELKAQTNVFAQIGAALAAGALGPREAVAAARSAGASIGLDQASMVGGAQVYASSGGAVSVGSGRDAAIYGTAGRNTTVGAAQDFIGAALASGDLRSIYNAAVGNGISSAAVDALGGFAPGTALQWALANGLPAFARGTNVVPRDMVAQVHAGEMIVPSAFNPATSGIGGNTQRLEKLVEGLTAEVQRLQTVVATGNRHAERTATVLDDAARGKQPLSTAA